MNNNLKVFVNKNHSGNLSYEDDKYIFNYDKSAKTNAFIDLRMRHRIAPWHIDGVHHEVIPKPIQKTSEVY